MPLARYFLFVGGALLALLYIVDSFLPELPVAQSADARLAAIRIHSEQKWPERIVYDTSKPTIVPAPGSAGADMSPPAIADVPTTARQAFAELQRSDASPVHQKKREPKRQRKFAKRIGPPPMFLVARQPQFGWFGPRIW
jgi:hypothetical protein